MARVRVCIGQRAAPGLFGADTALTGGVGVGGFGLLCGMAFAVLFYLLAGELAALLYGEIGVYAPVLFGSKWLWYQASGNKVFLNLNIPLLHNLGFGWSH